ncbi:ornithine cyclodeaminase family protein [Mordavella massiliensis]|uniref:Ornithine cyclodeaminase family protein n=1 Tax=Mordavella massiliensis TaxID=1871024 RepID=A0A938X5A4_9CLOT|nr:ornithine cyclodeaminase family protein [Mordavella massiliensis]MBM6827313.1 ornithine cyclodeaminase family protein [Mordavella massiliensis]
MLLLSREDIKKVFTIKDAIEADKKAFRYVVEGKCEIPLRTNIQAPKYDGCFLFMPAYLEEMDTASLKIINIFPHNIDNGIPSSPAQVLLIDGKTGLVTAVLDGTYVTQLRTGAASGAAFDVLAKKDCRIGALIGTGGQAPTQLEAMLAARTLQEVRVYDMNPERTKAFAEIMQEELKDYGARIVPAASSDEAIDDADLIITVTPSSKPVFDGTKVKAGATISCVGAYQHHMQEMDPAILPRASKIYFDSREAVLSESGDILIPLEEGIITEKDFTGDLGDVLLGKVVGRENDDEIIVFETVGVAAQDLVAAKEIYEKAVKAGVGITWG